MTDPETTLCEMRDLLRSIDGKLSERPETGTDDDSGRYECEHCGETFGDGSKLGGHVSQQHDHGLGSVSDGYTSVGGDAVDELLWHVGHLPSPLSTSTNISECFSRTRDVVSKHLLALYRNGLVGRDEESEPYVYWLTDEGQEWLESRDYDGGEEE